VPGPPAAKLPSIKSQPHDGHRAVEDRHAQLDPGQAQALLGYLNLSDGRPDPRWQKQLNDAFARLAAAGAERPWQALIELLLEALEQLHQGGGAAFRDATQARDALTVPSELLPAYRRHHAALLAPLGDAELFGPYSLARALEAPPQPRQAEDGPPPAAAVLARLNDFVGHRPVAILESRPQGEP